MSNFTNIANQRFGVKFSSCRRLPPCVSSHLQNTLLRNEAKNMVNL